MKKMLLISAIIVLTFKGFSQVESYWSTSTEMIFSFATIDNQGDDSGNIMRWAPVLNVQGIYNIDLTKNVGIFTGIALRNVGFIYDNYSFVEDGQNIMVKKKFRTYNAGIPVGLKLGDLNGFFIYGGYEVEYPLQYKEKTFRDEKKTKFSAWFSDRVEPFQHGVIAGVQFPYGGNLKFKYYFSNFHNKSYTESTGYKPYENLNSNVFYVSLNFNMFAPVETYYKKEYRKEYY